MNQNFCILSQAINQLQNMKAKPHEFLAVFDLDSTLFDVAPRIDKIIQEFTEHPEYQQLYPHTSLALKEARILRGDWGIEPLVERALEKHNIKPESPQLMKDIVKFWRKHFFTNSYLHYDEPYPGAVEFVNELAAHGAHIIYLTGRDIARMGLGSEEVLKKWNFPMDSSKYKLALKPHKDMDDAEFKTIYLMAQLNRYKEIWFFENEPLNIEPILEKAPSIKVVFFDSAHSGRTTTPTGVPKIENFIKRS